jgi:hypothetical protein
VGKIEIERKRFDGHCHSRLPPNASAAKKKTNTCTDAPPTPTLNTRLANTQSRKQGGKGEVIRHLKKGNLAPRAQDESGAEARKATRTRGAGIRKEKNKKGREGKMETKDEKGRKKKEGT